MFEANGLTMLPQELLTRVFNELSIITSCVELADDRRVCKAFDKIILPILFQRVYVAEFNDKSKLQPRLRRLGENLQVRWNVRNGALDIVSHHTMAPPAVMVSAWCKFARSLRRHDDRLRDELLNELASGRQCQDAASVVYLNHRVERGLPLPAKVPLAHRRIQSLQRRFSLQMPADQSRHPKLFRQVHITNSSIGSNAVSSRQQFEHFGFLFAFPGQDTAEGVSINVLSPLPHGNRNAKGIQVPIAQRKNLRFMPSSVQTSGLDCLLKSYPDLQKLTIYASGVCTADSTTPTTDSQFSVRALGDLLRRHRPPLRTLIVDIGPSPIPCQPSAFPIGSIVFLRSLTFLSLTEWSLFGMPNPMHRQDDIEEDSRPYADYHWVDLSAILPSTLQRLYIFEDDNAVAEQSLSFMRNSNAQCLNLILSPKFGSLKFIKLDRRGRVGKVVRFLEERDGLGVEGFGDEPRDLCYLRPGYAGTQEELDFALRVDREQDKDFLELVGEYREKMGKDQRN